MALRNSGNQRQFAFMASGIIGAHDDGVGFLAHGLAMEEGIDFHVADAVGFFIGLARAQLFQVRCRYFENQIFRCAQVFSDGPYLAFNQAR